MAELAPYRPGFFEAVVRALRQYVQFEGRATRAEFWWYALFYVLVFAFCNIFTFVELTPAVTLGSVFASLFALATLLPTLAVGVRRLRDSGSGWGPIFWLLLPVFGVLILAVYWTRPTHQDDAEDFAHWTV